MRPSGKHDIDQSARVARAAYATAGSEALRHPVPIAWALAGGQVFGARRIPARLPRTDRPIAIPLVVGLALLGGVVAWKVVGSTYERDVQAICEAELRCGYSLRQDMADVTRWVRANLTTPDGNRLFSSLRDTELEGRAGRLRRAASALGIGPCPLVQSYEQLALDAASRSDLQQLCSRETFPDLGDLDDDARLATIEDWIDTRAKSGRTKQLAEPLRHAPAPDRAAVLRAVAVESAVFSCDVAKTLDVLSPPR